MQSSCWFSGATTKKEHVSKGKLINSARIQEDTARKLKSTDSKSTAHSATCCRLDYCSLVPLAGTPDEINLPTTHKNGLHTIDFPDKRKNEMRIKCGPSA